MDRAMLLIRDWFADGDTWVGVFENREIGHRDLGRRCAFPFSMSDGSFDSATIWETRAPDGKHIGLGWPYLLVAKCRTPEEAYAALHGQGEQ